MSTRDAFPEDLHLTERQRQVLDMLARGRTNPQIAEALGISLPGAKWHVSEVMNKLGAGSREEAAEAWAGQRGIGGRIRRVAHGFAGIGLLKAAALGGGVAVAGVAAAGAVAFITFNADADADDPAPEGPAAAAQARIFARSQAEQRAKELAVEVMAPYSVHVIDPADDDGPRTPSFNGRGWEPAPGRPVEPSDFVVLDAQFVASAAVVETNTAGAPRELTPARDVWVVRLALQPPWELERPAEASHLVVFEDGSGALIDGGRIGKAVPGEPSPSAPEPLPLAMFDAGTVRFWLFLTSHPLDSPEAEGYTGTPGGYVCLSEVDSRWPGSSIRICLGPDDGAMYSTVYNSQGFAHGMGIVSADVAQVRLVTEDGREIVVEPGPLLEGQAWRGFIAAAPGPEWFVLIEALDAAGNILDSSDSSDHPTNPPLPGATPMTPTAASPTPAPAP